MLQLLYYVLATLTLHSAAGTEEGDEEYLNQLKATVGFKQEKWNYPH